MKIVLLRLALFIYGASAWRVCDITSAPFFAAGDGLSSDTGALRSALKQCDEVHLKKGRQFLSGPLNLTSNQVLNVEGSLLASKKASDYPLVAPILGYGWGNDENCFPPDADKHKIIIGIWSCTLLAYLNS